MDAIKFATEIETEFPCLPPPRTVIRENVYEDTHDDVFLTESLLKGKKWVDVKIDLLTAKNIWHSFSVLTEEAFEYYFPAFLLNFALNDGLNCLLLDAFLDEINPRNASTDERLSFYIEFSEKKGEIVCKFLKLIFIRYQLQAAQIALDDYWDRFEKS